MLTVMQSDTNDTLISEVVSNNMFILTRSVILPTPQGTFCGVLKP